MTAGRAIVSVPIDKLRPNGRNCRTHPETQIRQVANSILQFGWTFPILVDERFSILAGHARYLAALQLGLKTVPVIIVAGLSEPKKRALSLADNKIAGNAGWDFKLLGEELVELKEALPQINLDLAITGFAMPEIRLLLGEPADPSVDPAKHDAGPKPKRVRGRQTTVSRTGDVWELGPHRVLCADALSAVDLKRLLVDSSAALLITGTPGNVPVDHGGSARAALSRGSLEMSAAQFSRFLRDLLSGGPECAVGDAIEFVFVDWRRVRTPLAAGAVLKPDVADIAVRRWQTCTQWDAFLAATREIFDDIAVMRQGNEVAR